MAWDLVVEEECELRVWCGAYAWVMRNLALEVYILFENADMILCILLWKLKTKSGFAIELKSGGSWFLVTYSNENQSE